MKNRTILILVGGLVLAMAATAACRWMRASPSTETITVPTGPPTQGLLEGEKTPTEEMVSPAPTVTTKPLTEEKEAATDQPDARPASQVSYGGIHFAYNPILASAVNPRTIEGQNMGEDAHPEATYPEHIRFEFDAYLVPEHFFTPLIWVYPVAEYQAISEAAISTINNLQTKLKEQPAGGMFSPFPSMPLWGAAQFFVAQVHYFDFQNGSGLRYLCMFGQDQFPPDNYRLVYIYQGITNDQAYYISAVLPITHPLLPDDGYESISNWEEFFSQTPDPFQIAFEDLEQADPLSFFPDITLLDAMMTSMRVD